MARIRMIKPEFFDDPDVGELSAFARLLFIGMWTQADREGRLEDDTRRLKARIFPYDNVDVEALAEELHGKDMIRRYEDENGSGYIWVRTFAKHQRPHPKEPASLIPECDVQAVKRNGKPRKATASRHHLRGILDTESGTRNLDSETRNLEAGTIQPAADISPALKNAPEGFDAFWLTYPRKTAKAEALKAWRKLNPSRSVQHSIAAALEWQVGRDDWIRDGGKYIPHPATWLNRGQWTDERPLEAVPLLSDVGRQNLANGRIALARILESA